MICINVIYLYSRFKIKVPLRFNSYVLGFLELESFLSNHSERKPTISKDLLEDDFKENDSGHPVTDPDQGA